ncbi:MAG TPA: PTS IIA-like nitrogen-regulatory protein PtsN [Acidiferrobacteraceae bacterium]|jgi:nitrogen PTS system EIIA component|nr:PTS IIA-like nitrogen-regulatory protein PtsN [Acidiferrobacteraceae bacterium]HEX19644.1 PTS IIA-like nitrogen-regulatory protein PtsN [Acidiferrobacteraceae bacterium]
MQIVDLLSENRVVHTLSASSKKRLLEKISGLLGQDAPSLNENAVFQCLTERERLGSTAIGEGVALPHGRLKGLDKAIGAFAVLEKEIDFEANDHHPINMVFALLVPEHANKEHLEILSTLATKFRDEGLRDKLLNANTNKEIYSVLTE